MRIGSCTTLVLLIAAATALGDGKTAATRSAPPLRVLFIGDAYTSANGGIGPALQAMGKIREHSVEYAASTSGGKTLQWHWDFGAARALIAKGGWDYVVLQEGIALPVAQRKQSFKVVRQLDEEIEKIGAKTVLLPIWPQVAQPEQWLAFTRDYDEIARELDALIVPAATAWDRAMADEPELKFHKANGPTREATYTLACATYAILSSEPALGLPSALQLASGRSLIISPATAERLQRSVDAELADVWARSGPATTEPHAKRVVYVVDATGTMLGLKFRLAQKQVATAIDDLSPKDRFNVIFFQGGDNEDDWRYPFSLKLQFATEANRAKALRFVEAARVVGKGTNPMPALRLAFLQRPDVIFFLTDGEFDNVVSYERVLAEIDQLNGARRTRLNTIAFLSADAKAEEILISLARAHGGRFRKVSDRDVE